MDHFARVVFLYPLIENAVVCIRGVFTTIITETCREALQKKCFEVDSQ